jgi:FlaA1/EpsC-like NDP-sugar epimerase
MRNLLIQFTSLPRAIKGLIIAINDSIIVVVVLLAAFYIRLGFFYWPENEEFLVIIAAPLIAIPIFLSFGLYKSIVRYIGLKSILTIFQAVTMYAVIWGLIDYMFVSIDGTPRSVIIINWMLLIIGIGGSRIIARWLLLGSIFNKKDLKVKIVIYGAGSSGIQLSESLKLSYEFEQIAFIDDDLSLINSYINNIEILNVSELPRLIKDKNVTEIYLALPSISRVRRQKILTDLSQYPLKVKSVPKLSDIAKGKVMFDELLQIDIKDLLGRNSAPPINSLLHVKNFNKVVLITGAGGSIGSELARQIIKFNPKKIILFDHSEFALYQIHQELLKYNKLKVEIYPILGSVRSLERLELIFKHFGVQTIYHAAAYKHVPMVESNQSEGILNNVIGTLNASKASISANVETFVLISTDKAVRPTNTMGAAKRCSELILQALSKTQKDTCFTMVRFGNVLDSSGSVIPLFKEQIKLGGPITLTNIDIVRYFMTISEAVELVIQSGAMAKGGDLFVLDMGKPVKIYELARKMIELSGLKVLDSNNPNGDIEIKITGLRPGEKLYEELLIDGIMIKTKNELIMRAEESMIEWPKLKVMIEGLEIACMKNNTNDIRDILKTMVPEYKPQS